MTVKSLWKIEGERGGLDTEQEKGGKGDWNAEKEQEKREKLGSFVMVGWVGQNVSEWRKLGKERQ